MSDADTDGPPAKMSLRRWYFCFTPDEFHTAKCRKRENYQVWLPDPRVDFTSVSMYDIHDGVHW